jgi:predicted enzyme related to lactoylglutathione lyase
MAATSPAVRAHPAPLTERTHVVHVPVRSWLRAIDFFAAVLGLEVAVDGRRAPWPHVVMAARGCSRVVLRPSRGDSFDPPARRQVVVADLDRVRARIWDAGLMVVGENSDRGGELRALVVRDRQGDELELVAQGAAMVAGAQCSSSLPSTTRHA